MSSLNLYYEKYKVKNGSKLNFSPVSSETIQKNLDNIDTDTAAGIDKISGKYLRDGASLLAEPISQLCNISIKYSTFPTECNIAKLKLLYKKGSKAEPKKYRPISLLPLISKIFEKVIHDQIQHFINEKNVKFYAQQMNISQKKLNLITQSVVNRTVKDYILSFIVLEAKKLLISSNLLSKEIAYQLGFDEPTNFTKFFKAQTGMRPSEFVKGYYGNS